MKQHSSTKHRALSFASGASKRRKPRDGNHAIDKKTRDLGVLQARDSPVPDNLQALLASLLGTLLSITDTLKNSLTSLVPRHHDRDDHCHDCYEYVDDRSHVHEHNQHEVIIHDRGLSDNHRREMDSGLVPGTVVVTDADNALLSFLNMEGDVFNASQNNATTLYLRPSAGEPGSDGQNQRCQLLLSPQGSYCATYDPNPVEPSAMTARPCTSQTTYHQSQLFSYDAASGYLQPIKATEEDSSPATDRLEGAGDDQATDENVRLLVRSSGTGLKLSLIHI